jgi:hypothetical protein
VDWINGKPSQEALKYGLRHIDFTAVAKGNTNPKDKSNVTIDLRIDGAPLYFDFFDDRYRAFVNVSILEGKKPVGKVMPYLLSYPEEEFGRVIKSKISLSITMKPSKRRDIKVLIFQSTWLERNCAFGIQPIQIQP